MTRFSHYALLSLVALWWGGMSLLSFVVVPILFSQLGPATAGPVAAHFFALQANASVGIAGVLLLLSYRAAMSPAKEGLARSGTWLLVALVAALVQEWVIGPQIVQARAVGGNLKLWHSAGTVLVVLQWLSAWRTLLAIGHKH